MPHTSFPCMPHFSFFEAKRRNALADMREAETAEKASAEVAIPAPESFRKRYFYNSADDR